MGRSRQVCSTSACNNGVESRRPPSQVQEKLPSHVFFPTCIAAQHHTVSCWQELRSAYSSDSNAATRHGGYSMLSEAEGQHIGCEGFTGALVHDVSSDSDSDIELNSDEEELFKLGDGIWVHEKYLAYLKKPQDIDILLYRLGDPDDYMWMAVAPEWDSAQGFGSSKREASDDLQDKLLGTKLTMMELKDVAYIKRMPIEPCWKNADKARRRWPSYFGGLEKDCSAWEWGKIRV